MLDFAYSTGLRASELVGATLGSIERDAHDDQWLHIVGKGSRAGKVALPPLARVALDGWRCAHARGSARTTTSCWGGCCQSLRLASGTVGAISPSTNLTPEEATAAYANYIPGPDGNRPDRQSNAEVIERLDALTARVADLSEKTADGTRALIESNYDANDRAADKIVKGSSRSRFDREQAARARPA